MNDVIIRLEGYCRAAPHDELSRDALALLLDQRAQIGRLLVEREEARAWARRWKGAAKYYQDLKKGAEWGLRNEIANNRVLMDTLAEMDDRRPIVADDDMQSYIEDLRGRLQVQQMYNVDLEKTIAALRTRTGETPCEH